MKNFRRILATAALAVAASGMASASSIIQTFSLPSTSTNTSWTQTSTINQFNTTLGTLEDIRVIAALTDTARAGATDITGNSSGDSYTISATTTLNLTDATSELLVAPSNSIASTFLNQSNGSTMQVSTSTSKNASAEWIVDPSNPLEASCSAPAAGCLFSGPGQVDPINYGAYEGGGTIMLTASAGSTGSFGGSSFGSAFASGTASVLVSVIYDYTASTGTPEPTTMLLFGSGLVGLGVIRRRYKKV